MVCPRNANLSLRNVPSLTFHPNQRAGNGVVKMGNSTLERFLSPGEAAEYLGGLHTRTLTRWAREGAIPAYPIGEGKRRLWRFLRADLQKWLLSRGNQGTLAAATDALNWRFHD